MAIIMVINHHYHLGRRLTGERSPPSEKRKSQRNNFSLLYFFCGGKGIIIPDSLDWDGRIPSGSFTYIALCELHI